MNRSLPKRYANLKVRRGRNRGIHHREVRMDWRQQKQGSFEDPSDDAESNQGG
jgi:hypothetical protein